MAAFDTPWTISMDEHNTPTLDAHSSGSGATAARTKTTAAFSSSTSTSSAHHRSTILFHQKSPLLLATPPQITRALAHSHAFIVPLNKIVGLLSWTTGDPWESFLLLMAFWFAALYGEIVLRYAGLLILVLFLILGMYFRRYSPLSSTGWTGEKNGKRTADGAVEHRKSLDEILETLQAFTGRCNILLAPMIQMTDFLSTQQTATSATTRPALTTLLIRILFASPFWFALTLPPLRIVTGQRILLLAGTLMLTWHSRPARISRSILWRSLVVRGIAGLVTGLNFGASSTSPSVTPTSIFPPSNMSTLRDMRAKNRTIRFTFSLYENQRRWIGLGWTSSMIAYERAPWTDEHLNAVASPYKYQLPPVEGGVAKWQWVEGSSWQVESPPASSKSDNETKSKGQRDEDAWVYYDNKWLSGTRGQDGWSKYTRRRKWVRDAELVDANDKIRSVTAPGISDGDVSDSTGEPVHRRNMSIEQAASVPPSPLRAKLNAAHKKSASLSPANLQVDDGSDAASVDSASPARKRQSWFGRARGDSNISTMDLDTASGTETKAKDKVRRRSPTGSRSSVDISSSRKHQFGPSISSLDFGSTDADASKLGTSAGSGKSVSLSRSEREREKRAEEDVMTPTGRLKEREADWGLGDDASMGLG